MPYSRKKRASGGLNPHSGSQKPIGVLAEYAAIKIDSDGNLAAHGPRLTFH